MLHDVIVVGAGMAGLPCAIRAADRGLSVLLIEATDTIGGKLPRSSGQIAAAETKLQKKHNIFDSKDAHLQEAWKICNGTASLPLLRLAVDNAAETVHWLLDIGVEFPDNHPVLTYAHDIYSTRRYQWPVNNGQSILEAFLPLIDHHIEGNRITLIKNSSITKIIMDSKKSVQGVRIQSLDDSEFDLLGRSVALTAGGYTNDSELFNKFSPGIPVYAAKLPYSSGSALKVAMSVNCKVDGGDLYKGMLGGVLDDSDDNYSVKLAINTVPQDRQPWEIWINLNGKRFTREDHPSATYREHAVNEQPSLKFFIVFDEGIRQNAPSLVTAKDEGLAELITSHPSIIKAESLVDLAQSIGVNATHLKETIDSYNKGVLSGTDFFSREHLPRTLETPPFYAIMSVAFAMPSPAGISVDERLRALDLNAVPIPNLYAAGEIIGNTRIMGNAYISGMGVGPTLTFGRLLGENLIPQ